MRGDRSSRRIGPLLGCALLLPALLFAASAGSMQDDDLPDRADDVQRIAADLAIELQLVCPPAGSGDQAAFDRCRRSLFGDSALRRSVASPLLWGRRNQDASASLKDTNLTQFAPDVITGLYMSLFMFDGEYSVDFVPREGLYMIRLHAGFRNRLPTGQYPYPFWHEEAKWDVYQSTNGVLLWVNPKTTKIVAAQFTERGAGSPVVATTSVGHRFDGRWMWTDKDGALQPRVTLFDGLFRSDNPYVAKLDAEYRTLALRMRDAQCDQCHVPNNPNKMRRLVLLHTPAHASGEITRLMKSVREDRMPLDDAGVEQPLEPAQKRALLESGRAFEALLEATKRWEASRRD